MNALNDLYAILLMTIINEENKKYMHKNKIPVLDYYFDKVSMTLWPKFTQVFETYLVNLKTANPKTIKIINGSNVQQFTQKYVDLSIGLYKIAST